MDKETKDQLIVELKQRITESCTVKKYHSLCEKIETETGMDWVVNRVVFLMAQDDMHFDSVLAQIESELDEMD